MESAAAKLTTADWAGALVEQLFPADRLGEPVVLCCDDDAIAEIAGALGLPEGGGPESLAASVRAAGGLQGAASRALTARSAPSPRAAPELLAALAVLTLAASRMGEEDRPTQAYYSHLRPLLGPPDSSGHPPYVGFGELCDRGFPELARWLSVDERGRRGLLALPEDPWPRWVGLPVSQVALRSADRARLGVFFAERSQELDAGWEPAGILGRHPLRHHLTRPAQALLADARSRPLLSAALVAARAAWDGTAVDLRGRRVVPGRLFAQFDSASGELALALSAEGIPAELRGVGPDGEEISLPPAPGAADVPLAWLTHAADGPVWIDLPGGRLRALPGPLVLFDPGPLGLEEIALADDRPAWALTSMPLDGGEELPCELPGGWRLLADVDPECLPEDWRPLPVSGSRARLRPVGGLPLASGGWLAAMPPALVGPPGLAGEVCADGEPIAWMEAGRTPPLLDLADGEGLVQLAVGDLDCSLLLVARGLREGHGDLRWALSDVRVAAQGPVAARSLAAGSPGATLAGAAIDGDGAVPRRAPGGPWCRLDGPVRALCADGAAVLVARPAVAAWERSVGWDDRSRWRLPAGTVWACQPQKGVVQRIDASGSVDPAGPDVAQVIDDCAGCRVVGDEASRIAWSDLVATVAGASAHA